MAIVDAVADEDSIRRQWQRVLTERSRGARSPRMGADAHVLGGAPVLCAIARYGSLSLPWLTVMAISVVMAFGLSMVVTGGLSTTRRAEESPVMSNARPGGSEASWVTYVGQNCWLPDPSGREACVSGTGGS